MPVVDSDRIAIPRDACPVLAAFVRRLAEGFDDVSCAALKRSLPSLTATARDGHARRRAWMSLDWLVRTHCAAWVEHGGDARAAEALRALPAIHDGDVLECAARALATLVEDSDAPWDSACAAAGDPAWDAVWPMAWNVARGLAWDAGFGAASHAARAEGILAGTAVFDAVRTATRDAAFTVVSPAAFEAAATAASTTNGNYQVKHQAAAAAAELALATAARYVRRQLTGRLEADAVQLLARMAAC